MYFKKELKEKVVSLHSGTALLQIIPETGGCISRYSLTTAEHSIDLLRPVSQAGKAKQDPLEMSCFPLVPFSNRIRNGQFSFQGQEIKLPLNFAPEVHSIHGHGWKVPWTLTEKSEDRVVIEYSYPADEWPFSYLVRQVFELRDSGLTLTLQITNTGKTAMPVGLGFHPYFVRTPLATITTKTEKMWVNDAENMPLSLEKVPETELLNQGLLVGQQSLDNLFSGWNREVLISWPEWRANLKITAAAPLDYLVVFTPAEEEYFCVEPVSHVTDAFNMLDRGESGHGAKKLLPGESFEGKVCFEAELD